MRADERREAIALRQLADEREAVVALRRQSAAQGPLPRSRELGDQFRELAAAGAYQDVPDAAIAYLDALREELAATGFADPSTAREYQMAWRRVADDLLRMIEAGRKAGPPPPAPPAARVLPVLLMLTAEVDELAVRIGLTRPSTLTNYGHGGRGSGGTTLAMLHAVLAIQREGRVVLVDETLDDAHEMRRTVIGWCRRAGVRVDRLEVRVASPRTRDRIERGPVVVDPRVTW